MDAPRSSRRGSAFANPATTTSVANGAHCRKQDRARGRCRDDQKRHCGQKGLADDQPAAIQEVAKRDQQQKPEAVADLRGRDDDADPRMTDAEFVGHFIEQRLGIIGIGHSEPACNGEEKHHPAR